MSLLLFLLGITVGAFVNWFVDRFGYIRKCRSPWSKLPVDFAEKLKRRPIDFFPLIGWISLRRYCSILFSEKETKSSKRRRKFPPELAKNDQPPLPGIESRFFWIRPILIEFGLGIGAVWLYRYEVVERAMTLPTLFLNGFLFNETNPMAVPNPVPVSESGYLLLFAVHFFFCVLMLTASLIDMDDYIIPDILTIPGTVLGAILCTFIPGGVFVPQIWTVVAGNGNMAGYTFDPTIYLRTLLTDGNWAKTIPFIFMACGWLLWCFALLDRRWLGQLGFKRAAILFFRRLKLSKQTILSAVLALAGILTIVWTVYGSPKQVGVPILSTSVALFNVLLGMTVGLLMVWSVRLIGRTILKREAMGFGDVMLMGMLGIYLGWQGLYVVFFLAPLAGLVCGIIRSCTKMEREIPYGPFLCAGALVFLLLRNFFWQKIEIFFSEPIFIAILSAVGLVLMIVLLLLLQLIKKLLFSK